MYGYSVRRRDGEGKGLGLGTALVRLSSNRFEAAQKQSRTQPRNEGLEISRQHHIRHAEILALCLGTSDGKTTANQPERTGYRVQRRSFGPLGRGTGRDHRPASTPAEMSPPRCRPAQRGGPGKAGQAPSKPPRHAARGTRLNRDAPKAGRLVHETPRRWNCDARRQR